MDRRWICDKCGEHTHVEPVDGGMSGEIYVCINCYDRGVETGEIIE